MASWPYTAFIGLIGQFYTSPTPRPLSLSLGLGGLVSLTGAYGPSNHHQDSWFNPLYYGGFGLNGLFEPFRPSTKKGPRGQLINPQGQVGPKTQVDPPEPVLSPKPNQLRNGQKHQGTQNWPRTTSGNNSAHGLWQPPEATSSAPRNDSPQFQGKTFPS
ncbi:hypothetical protein O181_083758 [Austropuccinia psidii MF-1]|uniref:Uncharacterized protein n=1 Tax=Austropuccinia psidii MF-1 TaxID=1389203 RepID=A0A9Q3IJW1_9BASI|nr:hypothetical protein [Austropuccinia psidii MF-1]